MPTTPPPDSRRISDLAPDTLFTRSGSGGVTCIDSTVSTNSDMAEFVHLGGTLPRVLIADHQDGGRGRFERRWQDVPGTAVALSALVPADRPAEDWGWLSLLCGLSVAAAIEEATGAERSRVTLKWPNDVLIDLGQDHGGKVCGILCERVAGPAGTHAVLGIGLNVSMGRDELPVPTATSLHLCGLSEDKDVLIAALLRQLDRYLQQWASTGTAAEAYRDRCDTLGQPVRLTFDTQTVGGESTDGRTVVDGVGVDVDDTGAIVVRTDEGLRTFAAADVTHLRPR